MRRKWQDKSNSYRNAITSRKKIEEKWRETANSLRQKGNGKEILAWLGIQLGFKYFEDWYKIKRKDFIERDFGSLLAEYGGSPSRFVKTIYPDHIWVNWRFRHDSVWNPLNRTARLEIISWLEKELKIESPDEWYRVSGAQIYQHISPNLFKQYPLEQTLQEYYPEFDWDLPKLKSKNLGTIKASQRLLAKMIKDIFPDSEVIENFQKESLIEDGTFKRMELDIYLPKELLAFEYQGQQHYMDIYAFGNLWIQKERDRLKKNLCQELGILLIEIPYWWDFKEPSLRATIHRHAPNLLPLKGTGEIIPEEPPKGFPKGPDLMHPQEWDGHQDLTGWWLSEKMDGVRAFWNGEKLISKHAKEIACPNWFIQNLPNRIKLDGELWMGRKTLELTLATLHSIDNPSWKDMKFGIFDIVGSPKVYEKRMEELKGLKLPSFAQPVTVTLCLGKEDLMKQLNFIISNNGEGLVATQPQSLYVPERTRFRLKVKVYGDTEVQVLEILPTGFYCLQTNGIECVIGCDFETLENPPAIGSVITVKHSGSYTNGTLRHPFYWRTRSTVAWEDISEEFRTLFSNANWTILDNRKSFFDALINHLQVLTLNDCYKISTRDVSSFGGKALLDHVYDGSLANFLQSVYPNHDWVPWKFNQPIGVGFWNRKENQRRFMDWLQLELGFKSLEDWYTITQKDIAAKGGTTLLEKFSNSPPKLVTTIYSEHTWFLWRFMAVPKGLWSKAENQKNFMDWFGIQRGFKSMEDWYKVSSIDIKATGGNSLLNDFHRGSVSELITSVYSNHEWLMWKFERTPRNFWDNSANRKKFMDWLAVEMNFKLMAGWYQITYKDIADRGGLSLLEKFDGKPYKLLTSVYPDHRWVKSRFKKAVYNINL